MISSCVCILITCVETGEREVSDRYLSVVLWTVKEDQERIFCSHNTTIRIDFLFYFFRT